MGQRELLKERRSVHSFKEENVNEEILQEIFEYASYAPTHYMTESWQVKLFQDGGKNRLAEAILKSYQRSGLIKNDGSPKTLRTMKSMSDFLLNIPHHAVIFFEKPDDPVRYDEEFASVCAFIQNAQLAAWELGVGMLWTITPYMHDPLFLEEIGLDAEKNKIAGVLQVGYPARTSRDKGRSPVGKKIEVIRE